MSSGVMGRRAMGGVSPLGLGLRCSVGCARAVGGACTFWGDAGVGPTFQPGLPGLWQGSTKTLSCAVGLAAARLGACGCRWHREENNTRCSQAHSCVLIAFMLGRQPGTAQVALNIEVPVS